MTKRLNPEIKVLRQIVRALDATRDLDYATRRRVLGWTAERIYSDIRKARQAEAAPPTSGKVS